MSTRSAVGVGSIDTSMTARYIHNDGYPTERGRTLWALIKRDGVVETMQRLLEHNWSYIELDGGNCYCHTFTDHHCGIDRADCACEPRREPLGKPLESAGECANVWARWLYLVAEDGVLRVYRGRRDDESYYLVIAAPLTGPEPDWAAIEAEHEG